MPRGMRYSGSARRPKEALQQALSLYRSRDADYGPAFALALLRESAPAHKIEADLEKRYPEDTSVQFSYLPALRALQALNQGDPAKALEMTQAAAPYDLLFPVRRSTPAPSSELSIQSTCVAWLTPEWAATARQWLSFKRFSIIQESR